MLHVVVYCDLTTLNARTLPAEALGTKVLCVEGWLACVRACRGRDGQRLTCMHADADQHKEEKKNNTYLACG